MSRLAVAAIALALLVTPAVHAAEPALPRSMAAATEAALYELAGWPTAYREDSAHLTGHYGDFVLAVRKDAAGTLCDADGDYCPFQVDANGNLRSIAFQGGTWNVGNITGTVSLPTGAATDRTTAAGPFSVQLSDGSAFYIGTKTGQLPSALVGGRLDVNLGGNPLGLALDATLTGGTAKAIARGGAKGATAAADATTTAEGADHQALDIQVYHGGVAKDPTQIRTLTSSDTVTVTDGSGPLTMDGTVTIQDGGNSITVDAPVGTPVAVRLGDGSAFYDNLTGAPVGTESGPSVRPVVTQRVGAAVSLTAQCTSIDACPANSTAEVTVDGYTATIFLVNSGTLAATMVFDYSVDGTKWVGTLAIDPSGNACKLGSFSFTNPSPQKIFAPIVFGAVKKVRVRLSSFTSGAATATGYVNTHLDPFALALSAQGNGCAITGLFSQPQMVGGRDQGGNANDVRLTTGNQVVGDVGLITKPVQATLTKGTQGAQGVSTQDLKDAGRTFITLTVDAATPASSETLLTFAKNVNGTVTGSLTSLVVTSGKTFRVQGIYPSFQQSSATATAVRVHFRLNNAGTCIATSGMVTSVQLAPGLGTPAANSGGMAAEMPIPDGLEIVGDGTKAICLSAIASSAAGVLSVTLVGYEY